MKKALLCIDYINDIVAEKGKLSGKGYLEFCQNNRTLENLSELQNYCRRQEIPVLHVRVGFSPSYSEQPKHSPLFGKADQFQALQLGGWGTEFHPQVAPIAGENIITKHRVSAFFATDLELLLRTLKIDAVIIAGVATDLAVEAAARDAHDRDFAVTVVADCCAAADNADHAKSLKTLAKIANIATLAELRWAN